ncbi:MAG: hypothetical protein KBC98_00875 [Candidatus Pacebacteria bacterium]|jgi:hypothetical protein|nr:hypothetical protein [Candidatus Paceibacterota bacterium]
MQHFGSFLSKLESFLPPETKVRMILIPFIEQQYKISIQRKNIKVQKNTIFFDVEPVIRAKLLQKKEALFTELQKNGVQGIFTIY